MYRFPLDRSILRISGRGILEFLQKIVTNDVIPLQHGIPNYSLLLTPQGRFLYDFFLFPTKHAIMLDCDMVVINTLLEKISKYILHDDIKLTDVSDKYTVSAVFDPHKHIPDVANVQVVKDSIVFKDPRSSKLGYRFVTPIAKGLDIPVAENQDEYKITQILEHIPDSRYDMSCGQSLPLEYNLFYAFDFSGKKGCYIGQEVTNRMYTRKIFKRSPYLIKCLSGNMPSTGTILYTDDAKVGQIGSRANNIGLALLDHPLKTTILNTADNLPISVQLPQT